MELRDNLDKLLAQLGSRAHKITDAMEKGLVQGMHAFEGQRIVKEQLSGRKSPTYGLNVKTGNARMSWVVKTFGSGINFIATLGLLQKAWYLKVHQHHEFSGWIYPKERKFLHFKGDKGWAMVKKVFIPKRLYITEEFKTYGHQMIVDAINRNIKEALKA